MYHIVSRLGLLTIVAFCLLTSSLHFLYGPGEDALKLTKEFGQVNETLARQERDKKLCQTSTGGCIQEVGQWVPQVFLFAAQLISGVGQALFYTLGIAYMDDNATKSKTPAMLSKYCIVKLVIFGLSQLAYPNTRHVYVFEDAGSSHRLFIGCPLPAFVH